MRTIHELVPEIRKILNVKVRTANNPLVVLDWGCGAGVAIEELAEEFGNKIRPFGYSNVSYREWAASTRVKYIHETKEDLLRYFKDKSIDFILSMHAITYIKGELPHYLGKLLPKLNQHGVIVIYPCPRQLRPKTNKRLYKRGGAVFTTKSIGLNNAGLLMKRVR